MNTKANRWLKVSILVCCCLVSGCASEVPTVTPRLDHVAFIESANPVPRLSRKVALVLSDDFVTYKHEGRTSYRFSIGPLLEEYAERVAKTFFVSVEIVHGQQVTPPSNADFVLTPKVLGSDLTDVVLITDQRYLAVDVEWTLKRPGGSPALWIETFEGQGWGRSLHKKVIESAVSDLWQQTVDGFRKLQDLPALQK